MKEIWKPVRNYECLYEVSNMGRVKSLNYRKTGKEGIMKATKDSHGYLQVHLSKDGKVKNCYVHRLVATVFCENPEGYTEVNHINEIKSDNRAENLEYCSRSYNNTYNGRAKKVGKKAAEKTSKPVFSVGKKSGLIMWWQSAREAERCTGISSGNIIKCCKGKLKSAGGFYWIYSDTEEVM